MRKQNPVVPHIFGTTVLKQYRFLLELQGEGSWNGVEKLT